jgi:hypothetical protein
VLFLPIAFGFRQIYTWSHEELMAHDPLLAGKEPFLNPSGFFFRAGIYLAVWSVLAWWFRSRSLAQDATGDVAVTRRLQTVSAPGMVLFAVTVNFASFDWVMSLDPHWYSTIFGVYVFSGCVLGILALLALLVEVLRRSGRIGQTVTTEHLHDLGKLLFAFVVFWGYIAFSQFMLIWYGNLPEETVWYLHRWQQPGWRAVSIALVLVHFVIPFFFLLPRATKRSRVLLSVASVWVLGMHYFDLFWLVMPAYAVAHGGGEGGEPVPILLLALTLLGVGGFFFATLGWLLRKPALVPVRDPRLPESLSFENM